MEGRLSGAWFVGLRDFFGYRYTISFCSEKRVARAQTLAFSPNAVLCSSNAELPLYHTSAR